jgi:hypothetical protein
MAAIAGGGKGRTKTRSPPVDGGGGAFRDRPGVGDGPVHDVVIGDAGLGFAGELDFDGGSPAPLHVLHISSAIRADRQPPRPPAMLRTHTSRLSSAVGGYEPVDVRRSARCHRDRCCPGLLTNIGQRD